MGGEVPPMQHTAQLDLVVHWDGDGDSANPLNWSSLTKGLNLSLISAMSFITYAASGP